MQGNAELLRYIDFDYFSLRLLYHAIKPHHQTLVLFLYVISLSPHVILTPLIFF